MFKNKKLIIFLILILGICGYLAFVDMPAPTTHQEQEIPRETLLEQP